MISESFVAILFYKIIRTAHKIPLICIGEKINWAQNLFAWRKSENNLTPWMLMHINRQSVSRTAHKCTKTHDTRFGALGIGEDMSHRAFLKVLVHPWAYITNYHNLHNTAVNSESNLTFTCSYAYCHTAHQSFYCSQLLSRPANKCTKTYNRRVGEEL